MPNENLPRIMLAATASGCGKTTLTCGIMRALINRGNRVTAFKSGPDYIDPMFHTEVVGANSRNLDLFLLNEETIRYLFCRNAKSSDISVIEGVMGYYDGISNDASCKGSSYHLATALDCPVILIVDCKAMASSIAAVIKGFLTFKTDSRIEGVILNRIHPTIYGEIKTLIESELHLPVLGYMPYLKDCGLESRHLGLVTAQEVESLQEKLERIADEIEQCIDLDRFVEIANHVHPILCENRNVQPVTKNSIRIAVAKDKAFCFYYRDSLDLLKELGAELIFCSPLNDIKLPEEIDGLFLGGGYPELYAKQLSENKSFLTDLKTKIENGLPCIAECGGFMYLHETMQDADHASYRMAGVVKGESVKTDHLVRFGYAEITANRDNLLCKKGESIRVHEFHYWDSTDNGTAFTAEKPHRNRSWECVVGTENLFAGYPHMHFYSNPQFAENFLYACAAYRQNRECS